MRRLARRLFTLCSAVSLAMCVAVCVLWLRSYRAMDLVGWNRIAGEHATISGLAARNGVVYVHSTRHRADSVVNNRQIRPGPWRESRTNDDPLLIEPGTHAGWSLRRDNR